jgi:3-deoxy-D-manno-octulosonic-acid transferase
MEAMQKIALALYRSGWRLAIPLLRRNSRLKDGFTERLLSLSPPKAADVWIQAASAGEAYLALSLVEEMGGKRNLRFLVTTNTRQGKQILEKEGEKGLDGSDGRNLRTAFFPFDHPLLMDAAVRAIDPRAVVLLETELWPGLLSALKSRGCPVIMVNARMTQKSFRRYRLLGRMWQDLSPERILAVSQADAKRYEKLFASNAVSVMPNIKFDRIGTGPAQASTIKSASPLLPSPDTPFLVLGSVRQEEEADVEKMLRELLNRLPGLVIGLFPRHMHRLSAWRDRLGQADVRGRRLSWHFRSDLPGGRRKPGTVILWDRFGELAAAYAEADAVFVGGSLAPLGGQNFLEPLMHGVVPVIGPSWENFSWAGEALFARGLVRRVKNWQEASEVIHRQIEFPSPREAVKTEAADYIRRHQGGTDQASRTILSMLDANPR